MKQAYEKPAIQSEAIFEALMAGCTITADDLDCQIAGTPNISE